MTTPTKAPRKRTPKVEPVEQAVEGDLDGLLTEPDDTGYAPIGEDGSVNPVRIGKRGRTPNPMVDLFELDGVMFQIPAKPSPALLLKFMREARSKKVGQQLAVENLMIALLGQEALDALAESPEVTEEDVADVFKIVAHIGFGGLSKLQATAGN